MKKSELEYMNGVLDRECQKLIQETNILKGIISNMLMNDEQYTRMFKISTPEPIHIKIDNGMCVITKGGNDNATMQEENSEVRESEHQDVEEGRQETETSCCD